MLKSVAEKSESSMQVFSEVDWIMRAAATSPENSVDSTNKDGIKLRMSCAGNNERNIVNERKKG
jgi:hypothetical protein